MHGPWHLGINTNKERVCLEQRSAHETLTVFKKCVFSCFPRKWLSISSLAELTILGRLTTAILSLPNDHNKPNQNQKNFFWRYLMSADCLIYIWPKFCVLRLMTILQCCRQCTQSAAISEGEEKIIIQLCYFCKSDASNLWEKRVCAYMDFLCSTLLYNLSMLEDRTKKPLTLSQSGLPTRTFCAFWKICSKGWYWFF